MDFKIAENAPVSDAIKRMAAHQVGPLPPLHISSKCHIIVTQILRCHHSLFHQIIIHHQVGALAVTAANDADKIIGIVSERDYLTKVALLGRQSKSTMVSEICTQGDSNLISVQVTDSVDECMRKVLVSDVRHLLVRDSDGKLFSLFSVKDLCKCVVAKHEEVVQRLKDFGVGKGAFFGSE